MEINANLVINDILMSLGEETLSDHLQEIKMALYANLCDYKFVKSDPGYEIVEECDVTYKLLHEYKNYLILSGKRSTTINHYLMEEAMKAIRKKILPEYFEAVKARKKNFELREDEDDAQEGDLLVLAEFEPYKGYSGREASRRIKYVLRNCPEYGLKNGYCIIGW